MEYTIDIHENVVSSDTITKLKEGYYYKNHNKATYKLVYYTYLNEWCDEKHVIYGRTLEAVLDKYERATGRLNDYQGGEGLTTEECAVYGLEGV